MRIEFDDEAAKAYIKSLKEKVEGAQAEASDEALGKLLEKLKAYVIEAIPDEGGWYDLYKQAISVGSSGQGKYEIRTRLLEIAPPDIPADRSLVEIIGHAPPSKVLARKGLWPIDVIPGIVGGYTCFINVKAASESEVNNRRTTLLFDLPGIQDELVNAGAQLLPFDAELPIINGKVMADVPFMALRLEHGLGGFPRTQIWSRLGQEAKRLMGDKEVTETYQNTFSDRWFGK